MSEDYFILTFVDDELKLLSNCLEFCSEFEPVDPSVHELYFSLISRLFEKLGGK